MPVKFRRYGSQPVDIANYLKDRQCNCRGPFHHCRNTDIMHILRGCKCDHGRMSQLSNPCPCEEPIVYGDNILIDPGFEATIGNGPNGNEIPGLFWRLPDCTISAQGEGFYTDGSTVAGTDPPWRGDFCYEACGGNPQHFWHTSTAHPQSGSSHLRTTPGIVTPLVRSGDPGGLYPVGLEVCDPTHTLRPYSGRIAAGDYVRYGVNASNPNQAILNTSNMSISFYTSSHAVISTVTIFPGIEFSGAYLYREIEAFAPANSHYFLAGVKFAYDPPNFVDVDNCILTVL